MFDATPSNLPVEPTVPPAPVTPSVPPPPAGATPDSRPATPASPLLPLTTSARKEPEDIFAGIEKGPRMPSASSSMAPGARGFRFPVRILLVGLVALIVLAIIAYILWVFVLKPTAPSPKRSPLGTAVTTPKEVVEEPLPLPEPARAPVTTPPPNVPIPVPTPQPALVPIPPQLSQGIDTDADGLTDVEEPFYNSDLSKSDTDGDSYLDGTELRNLFDPSQKGKKLVDAPFMSTLGWNRWIFLAPKPWSIVTNPVLAGTAAAYVATGSATRFLLEERSNAAKDSMDAWLAANQLFAPTTVKTISGIEGRQSSDGRITYLPVNDRVLILTYDMNGDPAFEYQTSYAMIVASLQIK